MARRIIRTVLFSAFLLCTTISGFAVTRLPEAAGGRPRTRLQNHVPTNDGDDTITVPSTAAAAAVTDRRTLLVRILGLFSVVCPNNALAQEQTTDQSHSRKQVLLAYATMEGQTERIARRIASVLSQESSYAVELWNIHDPPVRQVFAGDDSDRFAAIVVGGSVHMFRYPVALVRFVNQNRNQLQDAPLTAFYSVSMSAAGNDEEQQQARRYMSDFLHTVQWKPTVSASFAGALRYSKMSPQGRIAMQMIADRSDFDHAPWKDKEYTDWKAVDQFALDVAKRIKEAS